VDDEDEVCEGLEEHLAFEGAAKLLGAQRPEARSSA
jgi:hypothetical protein